MSSSPDDLLDEPTTDRTDGAGGDRGRRVLAELIAVAVLIGAGVLAVTRPWQADGFCEQVADLPAIESSIAASGSPGPALEAYADALDGVADAAPSTSSADAARTVAAYQRDLGTALGGRVSSADVVERTAQLEDRAAAVQQARDELDTEIARRC